MSKKRSDETENAQLDLFSEGVGARHDQTTSPSRGGEYLKNCDFLKVQNPVSGPKKRRDPRFDELERIGLPAQWIDIANIVGVDSFLDIWRMLSADERIAHDGGAKMPKLRCYSAYMRFQRNVFIRQLSGQGIPPKEIQRRVRKDLCEFIDITNINRIARKK